MTTRCMYCGKYTAKEHVQSKCKECEKEYRIILDKLTKQRSATCHHNHK